MKKQIAVLMAAATAVTTVAPVIANADVTKHDISVNDVVSKMKNALNIRYEDKKEDGINSSNANNVDAYLNSRYAVLITGVDPNNKDDLDRDGLIEFEGSKYDVDDIKNDINDNEELEEFKTASKVYVVKDASKVQGLIEKYVIGKNENNVKIAIIDKGIKDGKSVETTTKKHYVTDDTNFDNDTEVKLSDLKKAIDAESKEKISFVDTDKELVLEDNKVEFTLTSGEEFTLENDDIALDLETAYDKDGNEIDLTKANTQAVLDTIVKFGTIDNKDDKEVTIDINNGDTDVYTVQDVSSSVINLGNIYTNEAGYTEKGEDFVNGIIKAREAAKDDNGNYKEENYGTFNYNGVTYKVKEFYDGTGKNTTENESFKPVIDTKGDGYELKYTVKVMDKNDDSDVRNLQFVIEGKSQKDLAIVLEDLKGNNEVVAGHFTKLQGTDRYATAIAVSEEKFGPEEADTVVIVGGDALMDGLSAVPLASVMNAPVLLADKNGLNKATLDEIDRACKDLNRKTVYIVGGENSVPEKAAQQLEEKFGCTITRLSGSDRFDTSLEVARRLGYDEHTDKNEKLFLVGGNGAADAMSISPVAAQVKDNKVAPILVVPQNKMKRTTRDFVNTFKSDIYLIGGESSLSSDIFRDANKKSNALRVSGEDRYATNVEIIKEFYTNTKEANKIEVNGAVFASGENKYLVDPQTAGPLAADKKAPIVLTGSKLTNDQVNLLKNDGVLSDVKTNVYQVGGVVSADVMNVVVDKLGL